ncbi:MAG: MFS transporter [Chloroflexota bacterium]
MKRPPRLYYGWIVAIAGAFVLLTASNFQYIFGVFVKPMANTFDWSRSAISGIASVRSVVFGILSPITGTLTDRHGPRRLVLGGVIISGLGYLLAAHISNLWQAYLFLGVFTGIASAAGYLPTITTVTRWFGGNAALANGVVLSGFSLAQIALPPFATWLILDYSWAVCLTIIGITVWAVGAIAWSFIRSPPQTADIETSVKNSSYTSEEPRQHQYTLGEVARVRPFWVLFAIYAIYALCFQMITVHVVAAAIDVKIDPASAALILTLFGITNTAGRLCAGLIIPKLGKRLSLAIPLGIQVPLLLLLSISTNTGMFYSIALVYGFVYGIIPPLIPVITSDLFGSKSIGAIFGAINGAYTTGMAIGPWLGGFIFDQTGSYVTAFTLAAGLIAGAFLLSLTIKPPTGQSVPGSDKFGLGTSR